MSRLSLLSRFLSRLHRGVRRCYPRRVRDRDDRRLEALLDRMLAEAEGGAGRRRILWRALADAVTTLPRAWLDALRGRPGARPTRSGLGLDVRLALRRLRRAPAYTAIGVLTLALAIGVTSAVFTLVDAFFLRPLPYDDPEELVVLWTTQRDSRDVTTTSPADYLDWRRQVTTLEDVAAFNVSSSILTAAGEAARIPASVVTPDFFDVLGVRPALGRGFDSSRISPGDGVRDMEVVLSHGLWERQFAADSSIVGSHVEINDGSYEIVGVMPEGFRMPQSFLGFTPARLWMPMDFGSGERPSTRFLHVFGRRTPGANNEAVRSEMEAIQARLAELYPEENGGRSARVVPIADQLFGDQRPLLMVLLGAAGLVLGVACLNMANLQLARGLAREREFAVRAALGSGRGGIFRELLVESGLLALLGGLSGAAVVFVAGGALRTLTSPYLNPIARIELDGRVVAFTLALSAGAGLLFGFLPALRLSRPDLASSLRERGSSTSGGRVRAALVAVEVGLTLVLIFGAGLLGRSFLELTAVSPGFAVEDVALFRVRPSYDSARESRDQVLAFYQRLEERLEGSGAFQDVAFTTELPLTSSNWGVSFTLPGSDEPERERDAEYHNVSQDYFQAAGIPLLEGRGFTAADGPDAPWVAVVNEPLARRLFGGESAVGQTLLTSGGETTIVGVVGATVDDGLDEVPTPRIFFPHAQSGTWTMWAVARTAGVPGEALGRVRELAREIDPRAVVSDLTTMRDHVDSSVSRPRGAAALTLFFGGLALVMATVGIYGVLASVVAERTRELGVRSALGARRSELVSLVLQRSVALAGLGAMGGLLLTPVMGRLLESELYEVEPWDPVVLVLALVAVLAAALAAGWIPARRAARVDPLVAIRAE